MSASENPHALLHVDEETLGRLQVELLDQDSQMAKRIRTVFTLRNIGGTRAVTILASGMYLTIRILCSFPSKVPLKRDFVIFPPSQVEKCEFMDFNGGPVGDASPNCLLMSLFHHYVWVTDLVWLDF
jgi:hypothetical protein